MTRRSLHRDGLALVLHDSGGPGRPIVLQHGLTGDAGQIAEAFPGSADWRVLTLECRGHGGSEAGDPARFSIATFAGDVLAALADAGITRAVVGGISMGAAIASRIAVLRPDLVDALVLIRPAWSVAPAPANMAANAEVGALLARLPADEAEAAFRASATAADLRRSAPDNLASLLGMFHRAPVRVTADLLTRLSADGPGITAGDLARIAVPTLVVGNDRDAVHPLSLAADLAGRIPGARLVTVTPKATSKPAHLADLAAALTAFLAALPRTLAP